MTESEFTLTLANASTTVHRRRYESRHAFEAYAGADSADGDIDEWLETARAIYMTGGVDVHDHSVTTPSRGPTPTRAKTNDG